MSTINYKGQKLNIISTHLDVFDSTGETREKQLKQLMSDISSLEGSIILCGDFNSLKKSDYISEELNWLSNNNKGKPLEFKLDPVIKENSFEEAFDDGNLKYSVWTGRRIDYVYYKGSIIPVSSNVYYTNSSDHFPLVADFKIILDLDIPVKKISKKLLLNNIKLEKSVKGQFDKLRWTHNTPYEVLYNMIIGKYKPYIKGLE